MCDQSLSTRTARIYDILMAGDAGHIVRHDRSMRSGMAEPTYGPSSLHKTHIL